MCRVHLKRMRGSDVCCQVGSYRRKVAVRCCGWLAGVRDAPQCKFIVPIVIRTHQGETSFYLVLAYLALELAAAGLRSDALSALESPLQFELQDSLGRAPPRPATSDVVESGSAAISRIVSKVQSSAHTGDPGRRQGVT